MPWPALHSYLSGTSKSWPLMDVVTLLTFWDAGFLHHRKSFLLLPLASFSSLTPQCSQSQILPPWHSLPTLCFLVGDPSILLLPPTSMHMTTRIYPNSETFHKLQSVFLTTWWSFSDFKLIIYNISQTSPFSISHWSCKAVLTLTSQPPCIPLVSKPLQLLLHVPPALI